MIPPTAKVETAAFLYRSKDGFSDLRRNKANQRILLPIPNVAITNIQRKKLLSKIHSKDVGIQIVML